MKKLLLLDRDGTLIIEPPEDFQVDSLEKLEFYPEVFQYLVKIYRELDYELIIITNQDGLGTNSFPEENFWPAHNKMLKAFKNEGITFSDILIDRSLPEANARTRKPGTDLLTKYMEGDYDLKNSFVIGDRTTDIMLARNLGAKGILLSRKEEQKTIKKLGLVDVCVLITPHWSEIYRFLKKKSRSQTISRKTGETQIFLEINLDGSGQSEIKTGIGFFNHMLTQIASHGGVDLRIEAKGDLGVDKHHTIEDTAITLGQAIKKALGKKIGIQRYGYTLPMDDSLAQVSIDLGGRPWLQWDVVFKRENIGEMPTEMFFHFFKSFSDAAQCNIHIKATGQNEHHKIESIFKAFARALRTAIKRDLQNDQLPSSKGTI